MSIQNRTNTKINNSSNLFFLNIDSAIRIHINDNKLYEIFDDISEEFVYIDNDNQKLNTLIQRNKTLKKNNMLTGYSPILIHGIVKNLSDFERPVISNIEVFENYEI